MKYPSLPDMTKALKLTQAGKLTAATLLLQGMMSGDATAAPTDEATASDRLRLASPADASNKLAGKMASAFSGLPSQFKGLESLPGMGGSASPEPVPDGAQFISRTYSNGHGSRAYKLYIPAGYKDEPMPLVVMLHGCTQSPDDFAAGTQMNALAEELGFLVAYPAQPASANSSKCWNWFQPGDQKAGRGEPSLIAGITRQVMQDYRVDQQRVYVAGLSAGGAAAAIMGAAYPDIYAAVGVHSGLACGAARDMPSAFSAMKQGSAGQKCGQAIPTIVFHGDKDSTVHPVNGEQVIAQVKTAGMTADTDQGQTAGGRHYTRTRFIDNNGQSLQEHWVIHGAGHAWSGGSSKGSYTDAKGPDASREMLRFFLEHQRK